MKNRHAGALVVTGLLAVATLSGCTSGDTAAGGGSGGEASAPVNIAMAADYDSLSPYKTQIFSGYQMATAFYDRLVALNRDGKVVPFLAKNWKATAQGASFKLRTDVKCSDGSRLTAEDVAASIKHLADPSTNAPYRTRTFGDGEATVTANNATNTVRIKLSQPYNEMLTGLAMPWSGIVCPEGLKNIDKLDTEPAGSGPYTLDRDASVRGSKYVLHLRDGYRWGPQGATSKVLPKTLVVNVVSDSQTVARELTSGALDLGIVPPSQEDVASRGAGLTEIHFPFNGSFFLMIRQPEGSPWADARLREALALSFSHADIAKVAGLGSFKAAESYLSPVLKCYGVTDSRMLKADKAAAARLLQEAGYSKNGSGVWAKNSQPLTLRFIASTAPYPAANEKLLNEFTAFGFDAKLTQMSFGALFDTMPNKSDWDVALFPYGPPIPTYSSATSFLASDGANNYSKIDNAEFDSAAAKGIVSPPNSQQQCDAWKTAQTTLVAKANIIPLFTPNDGVFVDKKIDADALVSFGGDSIAVTSIRISK